MNHETHMADQWTALVTVCQQSVKFKALSMSRLITSSPHRPTHIATDLVRPLFKIRNIQTYMQNLPCFFFDFVLYLKLYAVGV